ncbi:MAG: ribosome silencing factor [Armatimonadetes bacterium]|nr:ribosome silencing factor [Armatimonadota bacterium]
MASTESKKNAPAAEKAELVREFADDIKAERIDVIDVRSKTPVTDFLVVCSGNSDTHVGAIADKVADRLRDLGIKPMRTNAGPNSGGWIYYDFGDVVFHVMLEEKRQFYDLETLWKTTPPDPTLLD